MTVLGKRAKLFIKLAVSFVIIYVLFSQLDWQQARDIISNANPALLIFPIVVMVFDRLWMAWKWRMLLGVLVDAPNLYNAIRVYYVSCFQGAALPLGGLGPDLVRYVHFRSSNISSRAVAVSIFMERIVGLLATIIVALVASGLLIAGASMNDELQNLLAVVIGCGGLGVAVLVAILFSGRLQQILYSVLRRLPVLREHEAVDRVIDTFDEYNAVPGVVLINLVLSIIEQLFSVVAFFLTALAFGVSVSFAACLAVIPFSSLVERLPVSYMGLGIREGVVVFLLGLLGVAYPDALVASTAVFLLFVVSLLPGALWSLRLPRMEPVKSD